MLQVSPARQSGGSRYLGASRDGGAGTDASAEFVHYTVHISPTPDRTASAATTDTDAPAAEEVRPQRSYISGTIFTGGLNCATRGHVLNSSRDDSRPNVAASGNMSCKMRGCDMPAFLNAGRGGCAPCDCKFMIYQECHMDYVASAGNCPSYKEAYFVGSDTDDSGDDDDGEAVSSSEERGPAAADVDGEGFSMVHSMKVPSSNDGGGKPSDFDHACWHFETKGTYGYGNTLWPKDGHDSAGATTGFVGFEEPPNFGDCCRRPLTRKTSVSQAILSPHK